MRDFSASIDIAAPTDRVWSIMSDVERWPEWTSTLTRVKRLDGGPLRPGSRAFIRQPKLPPAFWRVVDVQAGKGFTWISRGPGVLVTAKHFVVPSSNGSHATLSLHYGGLLGGMLGRMIRGINE